MLFANKEIGLAASFQAAFEYIANPKNLVHWTHAFVAINDDGTAKMATPAGEIDIQLETLSNQTDGTIDWKMTFADGSEGMAYSRLVPITDSDCAYTFTLTPPPVPLEQLEGALAAQSEILAQELVKLQQLVAG